MANEPAISYEEMTPMVHFIRGQRVMLDSDLAKIYGVETKRLKEQFNRNRHRFPDGFAFQLEPQEFANLRSQSATSRSHSAIRELVQPDAPENKREIGFHIREKSVSYRTRNRK